MDDRSIGCAPGVEELGDPSLGVRVVSLAPDRVVEALLYIDNHQCAALPVLLSTVDSSHLAHAEISIGQFSSLASPSGSMYWRHSWLESSSQSPRSAWGETPS